MATLTGCFAAFAQKGKTAETRKVDNRKTVSEAGTGDNLNKTDARNRKQGLWFYKHEARMGEPLTYEYGSYYNDRKTGTWTRLDAQQELLATENYTNGVLNGSAQYYENGRLVCIGTYRGLNPDMPYDSIWVTNPETYIDSLVVLPSEIGYTKHGLWRYYDTRTGHLTKEEEYQVDNLIRHREFTYISGSDSTRIQQRNASLPHNKKKAESNRTNSSRSRKSLIE